MTATIQTAPRPRPGLWSRLQSRPTRPYAHPYFAAALLGLVLFASFFLTGNGLGASGGLNRILVYVEDRVAPEHVDRVPYLINLAGGDRNALDDWVVLVAVGAVLGGFVSGWRNGRLKLETAKGPRITTRRRWLMAFAGGAFMGFGARFARGCTSGPALSGGAAPPAGGRG